MTRSLGDIGRCESLIRRFGNSGRKKKISAGDLTRSAVLLLLFEKDLQTRILFIRRSESVRYHRGEIAFPGGRLEPYDRNPADTALRETYEEIGVPQNRIRLIAELHDYVTPYRFHITPFAGILSPPFDFKPDPFEVAEIIDAPLTFFLNPQNYRAGYRMYQKTVHHLHFFTYQNHTVWGITGYILYDFLKSLAGVFSATDNRNNLPGLTY